MSEKLRLLTDDETRALIMALARGHGEGSFTEAQALALHRWAEGVLVDHALLQLALRGEMNVRLGPGLTEPLFCPPDQGGPGE